MKNKVLNKLLLLSMLAVLSIVGYALFASDHSIVFAQEQAPAEQPKAPANPPEPPKAPEPPKEPVASKTYTKDEPHPTIQFEVITFDFGESTQNADLTHDFKFKNVGQRELEIVNVQGG